MLLAVPNPEGLFFNLRKFLSDFLFVKVLLQQWHKKRQNTSILPSFILNG
jgi:hypothetical protein